MVAACDHAPRIRSPGEFFAHALAIEREAAIRYMQFADQMLSEGNRETAELFERLAQYETAHHGKLQERTRELALPALNPWEYRWIDPHSPEAAPLEPVHYSLTPWHAVRIALVNELRAKDFFEAVAALPGASAEVRRLATEFAAEEHEHAGYLEAMLVSMAPPPLPG
ncbi:hypothetical protein BWI17_21870 [Betaproteobacteria bacterium GR16-43]|nr:hypothetical protein BWI17_21870 [Betaproteobacteria bacterium GR16-43]